MEKKKDVWQDEKTRDPFTSSPRLEMIVSSERSRREEKEMWDRKRERSFAHLTSSSPEELSFLSGAEEEEKIFSFSPHINKFSEGERGVVVVVVVVLVAGGLEISINKMKKELC